MQGVLVTAHYFAGKGRHGLNSGLLAGIIFLASAFSYFDNCELSVDVEGAYHC